MQKVTNRLLNLKILTKRNLEIHGKDLLTENDHRGRVTIKAHTMQ